MPNVLPILYIKLEKLNEKIVSRKFLLKTIQDVMQDDPNIFLKQLRENKKIKYIFQNYYYVLSETERKTNILEYSNLEIVYTILNKLNLNWYVSFEKGLEINNVVWQSHKTISVVNNKISKKCKIRGIQYHFRKTQKKHIFGYESNKISSGITQNIGYNEKIAIDYVYFRKDIPLELLKVLDFKKIESYLNLYSKGFQKKFKEKINEKQGKYQKLH